MITFTPLAGAAYNDSTIPVAYILEIDEVKILLDCGSPDWHSYDHLDTKGRSEAKWKSYCTELQRHAPSIDLVLLSHGDLAHSGLYAYAHARWGLTATAYTTLPVQATARIAALEEATDMRREENVDGKAVQTEPDEMEVTAGTEPQEMRPLIATTEEINEAFQSITTLRYSQPTHLAGKCHGITIIPFASGHTIGGTIWKIRSPSAGTLVYAINLNHLKERHLDGSVLRLSTGGGVFEPLARPDVMITDAERALTIGGKRKERDEALLNIITDTLSGGHSLLLPIDSSTRLLELLVLTDQHWAYKRLRAPICLLSSSTKELLTTVRSMMEWLGGTISKEDVGESTRTSKRRRLDDDEEESLGALALRFKFIEIFATPEQMVEKFSSREPKLILAVPASMSHGPSRSLFADFAAVQGNVVIITQRAEQGTLSRFLMDRWEAAQEQSKKWQDGKLGEPVPLDRPIELELRNKVLLQGEELEKYREKEKAAKEKAAAERAAATRKQQMREEEADTSDSESGSSDDSDSGEDGALEQKLQIEGVDWNTLDHEDTGLKHQSFDIFVKGHLTKTSTFFKTSDAGAPRYRMFPYIERKRRLDDFGEIIDVSAWLRKGKILDQNVESEATKAARLKKAGEVQKAPEEAPSKFIKERISIDMRCQVYFIDLEGVHDGRALKNILPHVNPRRIILVQATSNATESLIDACRSIRSMTTEIYAPRVGETLRVGEDMRNFTLALSDALMSSIKMSTYEDSEIAFIKGRISIPANSGVPVLQPLRITAKQNDDTQMDIVEASNEILSVPRAVMIGDLKLTSLQVRLNKQGILAEFAGEGILVCRSISDEGEEDTVAVRKTRKGEVRVEGDASLLFYTVREEIYKLHALVETE
ncbi:hypothetical protein CPB86DRAFT_736678 [Serendipita vermifera]|nr:hypothetical protein CPB86DRAFT_736678 [Serendipita vermifera]